MQNNMSEKSNSFRTPLTQIKNFTSSNSDLSNIPQDGSGLASFKNFLVKNDEKSQELKFKKETSPQEKDSNDNEYVKTLRKALGEALEENDNLRNRVAELEALLAAANDEVESRDKAILELASLLENQVKSNQNKGSQSESSKK